ncbi:MAG: hypothetical protein MAG715_00897 [Methanonatronarchaeales archaeon]|nr:hypothetical protein [Methanonatronarchaeales archaeon]
MSLFVLLVAVVLYHSHVSAKSEGRRGSRAAGPAMLLTTVAIVVTAVYLGTRFF